MTRKNEMRLGEMTDGEIKTELMTATGERLADLGAERAERLEYRASWNPDLSVGWQGLRRAGHSSPFPAASSGT